MDGIYTGVNGVTKMVTEPHTQIDGVVRQIAEGYAGVAGATKMFWQLMKETRWIFDEGGTFTVPKTGYYAVELHGGGGGGGLGCGGCTEGVSSGGGGGGSGERVVLHLVKGETYQVVVGAGGEPGERGGTSSFGANSVGGGYPGGDGTYTNSNTYAGAGGNKCGSLASPGEKGSAFWGSGDLTAHGGSPGSGGCAIAEYSTRGTGGTGGKAMGGRSYEGDAGKPGVVIVDYLGTEATT